MNPAMIKQFLNSDLAKPLDTLINEKTGLLQADTDALQALLGAANPATGDTTTAMNFLKLIYNKIGQDDPVSADRTNIMNYLKLLESAGAAYNDPFGLYPRLYSANLPDITYSANVTLSDQVVVGKKITINAGVVVSTTTASTLQIIVADELVVNGTLTASGKGGAKGALNSANTSGVSAANQTTALGGGGGGGGSITSYVAGAGGSTRKGSGGVGVSNNNGTNGTNLAISANLFSDIPITALFAYAWYGAGGAAGCRGTNGATDLDGGNGGGGLIIVARKITIGSTGAIYANGINGVSAHDRLLANDSGGGGGGGGGGVIFLSYAELVELGIVNADGGIGGSGHTYNSSIGYRGGNGGPGLIHRHKWL